MTKKQSGHQSGGFNFNNTGNVSMKADGDIVAGSKLTQTTVAHVFHNQPEKEKLESVIDEITLLLEELRPALEKTTTKTEDKRKLTEGASAQLKTLRIAKKKIATLPVGHVQKEKDARSITKSLDQATHFVAHLKSFAKTAIGFGTLVSPILTKLEPAIQTARSLFGLG